MYILVKILKGFPKPLLYKINSKLNNINLIGKIVCVPLRNKNIHALVIKTYNNLPKDVNFAIKEIVSIENFPNDPLFHTFIKTISEFYFVEPFYFYQRIRSFLSNTKEPKTETLEIKKELQKKIILTNEQKNILDSIEKSIGAKQYYPSLLHGVTSSGKTEIYKKLIIKTIEQNQSVILLLPEVSLSLQFQLLLQSQLPAEIQIIGFHSASKLSEKKKLWQNLLKEKPCLIIGVHLPILLPIPKLGLIIVDEEHESGFQEKKHPKINSKELAIWRAQHYQIPILLGSATPSLNSLYNVKKKNWKFFQLKKRFAGNFPSVKLVFLSNTKTKRRNSFWISQELEKEIKLRLQREEQTIIYLNRRGYSFFVQCKVCGFIFQCSQCSVSLTLHTQEKNMPTLRCHYCNYQQKLSTNCPDCKAEQKNLLKKGIGTQQVVKILQELFPSAKICRADLDSASKKKSWYKTVKNFKDGKIDILVGTQLITKGYHFPNVTLVGILWADLNLHFPLFNAAEITLQKLIQVAGRAGRQTDKSKVIVQAMHDHEIFNYLSEQSYISFCKKELEYRKITNYPPFGRLIQIELKHTKTEQLDIDAITLKKKLDYINKQLNLKIQILGPARPIIYKIQKSECRQIFLKTDSFFKIQIMLKKINIKEFESKIFIVPTP